VRIIVLVLAVLALFYFDAKDFDGNRNQLPIDGTVRHGHNAGGADVHCEIFVRSDRGQVNA
jgi:hypothetical protein